MLICLVLFANFIAAKRTSMQHYASNTYQTYLADHQLAQYVLIGVPAGTVVEKLQAEKMFFDKKYGTDGKADTAIKITIAHLTARPQMEETIIRYMHRALFHQPGFEVVLNNYSGFPHNTIYLRVQDQQPFKQLAKHLDVINHYVSSCSCPPVQFSQHPHISIAKKLPYKTYLQALLDYGQRTFFETFELNRLLLMRKDPFSGAYKLVQQFNLKPGTSTQWN